MAPSGLPHSAVQTSHTQICQCTSFLTFYTPSVPVMSLQHLLRRSCLLFWFQLNCVMFCNVGNCPLVTSLRPLNTNLNLAFWRWRACITNPYTILWDSIFFTIHSSRVSKINLDLTSDSKHSTHRGSNSATLTVSIAYTSTHASNHWDYLYKHHFTWVNVVQSGPEWLMLDLQ